MYMVVSCIFKKCPEFTPQLLMILFLYFTFPYNMDLPAICAQFIIIITISLHVFTDFLKPEISIGFWPFEIFAVVFVPETAVYKNSFLFSGKNDIWFSGQIFSVKSVSISIVPEPFAYDNLRFCVFPFYLGHVVTALLRGMDIHEYLIIFYLFYDFSCV